MPRRSCKCWEVPSLSAPDRRLLSRFLYGPWVKVLAMGAETAEHHANVYAQLRRRGRSIPSNVPSNDMWVAASAREHGLVLFTRDVHFREIEGRLIASSLDQLLP